MEHLYETMAFSELPPGCFKSEAARRTSGLVRYRKGLSRTQVLAGLQLDWFADDPTQSTGHEIVLDSDRLVLTIQLSGHDQKYRFGEQSSGHWMFRTFGPCRVEVGKGVTSNGVDCFLTPNAELIVEDDCMFSLCHLHVGDGHAIFDVASGELLNVKEAPRIHIRQHVWVALLASILSDSDIGAGSIVASKCVVKGTVAPCTLMVGVPAVAKKTGVSWSRWHHGHDRDEVVKYLAGLDVGCSPAFESRQPQSVVTAPPAAQTTQPALAQGAEPVLPPREPAPAPALNASARPAPSSAEPATPPPSDAGKLRTALNDWWHGTRQLRVWWTLARYDIVLRYRRSMLGPLWLTLSMGAMIAGIGPLYSQLFGINLTEFFPYLALGIIFWFLIAGTITDATSVFMASSNYLKLAYFPTSLFVWRMVARNLLQFCHHVLIFLPIAWWAGIAPSWKMLYVLPALALFVINAQAVGIWLGILCARFRDVPQIVTSVVQMLMFLTPVFWMADKLPERSRFALLNPLAQLLDILRAPLLNQDVGAGNWEGVILFTSVNLVLALLVFMRYRRKLIYWL
ncbi:MAG: ABC transporter permease [Pseudomonadota bacterium]|nr:ABC transporter permease [Pseudomonadota bacterium]